jgi:uncharacterized protein YbjT (DUF2867 family)
MQSTRPLKILVYGATGSQAAPTVSALLERGHRPFVLTRAAAKAAHLAAAGAAVLEGDMGDPARLAEASAGMDGVALLIPAFVRSPEDALAYGRNAIEAARAAGVGLIVWNTSGVIPPAPTGNPMNDLRIDIAEALRASGVPHITIQPTLYAENLLGPWTAPFVAQEDRVAYPTPPELRVGWIASADVGLLVAAAFERPELAGRSFVVSGIEAPDGPESAQAFSAALGRPISYRALPPREFGAILDRAFGPGAGGAVAAGYEAIWAGGEAPPTVAEMGPVLAALPVRMRTMREWVAEHAAAFQPVAQPA